jgi:hypothetical protein
MSGQQLRIALPSHSLDGRLRTVSVRTTRIGGTNEVQTSIILRRIRRVTRQRSPSHSIDTVLSFNRVTVPTRSRKYLSVNVTVSPTLKGRWYSELEEVARVARRAMMRL